MATIVRHIPTGKHYILLGAGFGAWASARPNRLLGDLFAADKSGQSKLLCMCDADGRVEWAYADKVSVISVDDLDPAQVLAGYDEVEEASR